jgi:hypothetical protein
MGFRSAWIEFDSGWEARAAHAGNARLTNALNQ